jgi:hypothetical protein
VHLVSSYYTEMLRCTVDKTLNLKVTTNFRLMRGLRIDVNVIASPVTVCSVVIHSDVVIVTVYIVHPERLYTCISDMLIRFLVQITSYVEGAFP